ncbi:glycoside hydrolase family protein [Shewanella frigidimarina]|uniref:glycoside hydrolase family protein n=1 Tax=Shewanella frigidimarina TaxID=56812 RepID=UPI003D7A4CDE
MRNLNERIKLNEGTIEYQTSQGIFFDNMFHRYKCTEGFWTIGYGHRCLSNTEPISISEADHLLLLDITSARESALKLHNDEHQSVNDVLTESVFQIGYVGLSKFKKMFKALKAGDYFEAANEMQNSRWFRQTPNRVQIHLNVLRHIGEK